MNQKSLLSISLHTPEGIEWYLRFVEKLQNFLALAMTRVPYPLSMKVSKGKQSVKLGRLHNPPIKVYYRPRLPYESKEIYRHEMLFTLPDIKQQADALKLWLEKSETIKSVFTLFSTGHFSKSF